MEEKERLEMKRNRSSRRYVRPIEGELIPNSPMVATVLVAVGVLSLIALSSCQGGMAELKSITGDEPYHGPGNAPAPIPRPMGFWGRSRYSPRGFGGMGAHSGMGGLGGMGGFGGYGGNRWGHGPDRFTSVGHSPYGAVGSPIPDYGQFGPFGSYGGSGGLLSSFLTTFLGDQIQEPRPFGLQSHGPFMSNSQSPHGPFVTNPAPSISRPFVSTSNSAITNPSQGSSSNLASITGGFYKGKGNELVGR